MSTGLNNVGLMLGLQGSAVTQERLVAGTQHRKPPVRLVGNYERTYLETGQAAQQLIVIAAVALTCGTATVSLNVAGPDQQLQAKLDKQHHSSNDCLYSSLVCRSSSLQQGGNFMSMHSIAIDRHTTWPLQGVLLSTTLS
jgi:hypothetical protein